MKVGFFQFDIVFGDISSNLEKVTETLMAYDFDLMVLPELFTTGYLFSSRQEVMSCAERIPDGRTTQALTKLAKHKQAYLVGGIAETDDEGVYDTAVVVGPEGYVGKHRKRHLTKLEQPLFDRGQDLDVFDLDGVTIGVLLCFDTWFPEACRMLMLKGAQIICSPANFGGPQSLDIGRVRAIENKVYTITANRIGTEQQHGVTAQFRGESQVIRYDGEILSRADGNESVSVVEIDPEPARRKDNLLGADLLEELACYEMYAKGGERRGRDR